MGDFPPRPEGRGGARAASQHRGQNANEGGIGFAPSFSKTTGSGVGGQAVAPYDLDSDCAESASGQASRAASPTPPNEAARLLAVHTNEFAAAVEGGVFQPQPVAVTTTTKRATTATRVGKRLAKSEQADMLRRMAESVERLEARVAKGLGDVGTELGALKCRARAIDELLQDELRDSESDEDMGMGGRHRQGVIRRAGLKVLKWWEGGLRWL